MDTRNIKLIKALSLTALLILVAAVTLGNNCTETRVLDDIVALDLNFQICSAASTFDTRGLTIRWEGNLRTAASGASGGEESFSLGYSVQSPTSDSPPGRSWFSSRVENLRAGEWDIEVEYILSGVGADITDRVEFLGSGGVYFTHRNDEASTSGFPTCP